MSSTLSSGTGSTRSAIPVNPRVHATTQRVVNDSFADRAVRNSADNRDSVRWIGSGEVVELAEAGLSYRLIGRHVGLSKNTVGAIIQRNREARSPRA